MEESSGLCIDPEEDEIFFYGITEEEAKLKISGERSVQLERNVLRGHLFDENKQTSEEFRLNTESANSQKDVETLDKTVHEQNTKLPVHDSGTTVIISEGGLKICESIQKEPTIPIGDTNKEECTGNDKEKKDIGSTNMSILGKREINQLNQNNISILEDHNYSTPVKMVIDKSILKTPKSIVKADKDGGFLKVLSEIALVKAEIDEKTNNAASVLSNNTLKKEITNDDNKENENCVNQNIMVTINPNQETPIKLSNSDDKELINRNKNEQCTGDSPDFKNDAKSTIETAKDINTIAVKTNELPDLESAPSCEEISHDSNDLEVIFENLTTDAKNIIKKEETEKLVDVSDLIKLDSFTEKPCRGSESVENHVKKDFKIKIIPQISILDESLHVEKDGKDERDNISLKNGSNTEEHLKKFLRRRTMNLLQELSEIVNHRQINGESDSVKNAGLSEEAAKVIQKLKAVGLDDSITSPDQYFDLDNLNETFLSTEMSDILNDTLSKPLDLLTNKDVELLLEKINCTTVEDKFQTDTNITEVLDAEKENLCQNKMQDTLTTTTSITQRKYQKTPVSQKTKVYMVPTQQKYTPVNKCLFDNKKLNQKAFAQSQTHQNLMQGCRTAEKAVKSNVDTRIPKLTSTTSKIPIKGSKDGLLQARNPILNKTPYHKATKSLKFNNIKSPVQAYINAKAPVLISNVKGKSETEFNSWMRNLSGVTKIAKPQAETKIVKNIPKSNLPVVNYRSAIPLKLDKSPESRLPRLAPKMQKLILGNSPVVAKHEGRIKLNTNSRPEVSLNESSIMLNPNEVSVIVRKVALSTTIKK